MYFFKHALPQEEKKMKKGRVIKFLKIYNIVYTTLKDNDISFFVKFVFYALLK